jgi:WD40 repeat protein
LAGHTDWISCLSFSPDGRQIASGSYDSTIRLWDAESGAAVGKPIDHKGNIYSLDLHFNNSDLFLTVNHTKVYNVSKNPPSSHAPNGQQFTSSSINHISFDHPWTCIQSMTYTQFHLPSSFDLVSHCIHNGKIAYGGSDGSIIIVDCRHLL